MICNKCGANLPDGARFCGACGNNMTQQPPVQPAQPPVYQAPVYQPPVQQTPVYQPPVQKAPKKDDKNTVSWASFAILMGCAALILICMLIGLYGSILDMPAMNMIATMSGADMDELEDIFDEAEDLGDELDEQLEYLSEEDLSKDEEKAVKQAEKLVKKFKSFAKTPSLMAFKSISSNIVKAAENLDELDIGFSLEDEADEYKQLDQIFSIIVGVIIVCFALGILLSVLAAFKRNNVLAVFALLVSVGNCMLMANVLLGVLLLVLFIAGIVMNNKYKAYKRGY